MKLPSEALPVTEPVPDPSSEGIQERKPEVEMPRIGRAISEFAFEIGNTLSDKNVFLRDNIVVRPEKGKLHPISPEGFITLVEDHMIIGVIRQVGATKEFAANSMKVDTARTVLAAGQFTKQVRAVTRLHLAPLPIMRRSGKIELLSNGHDAESQTLTMDSGISLRVDMPLEEARAVFDALLKEFPFNDDGRSIAVVISAMASFFGSGLLPAGAVRPVFILVANAEGAGKTTLAMVCVVPVLGFLPVSVKPRDDEELRKALDSAVMEGASVLVLDNTKTHINSAVLEAFTTAPTWSGRVLGVSKTFTCENLVTVLVTANGATLTPDLRRRSLIAEMFVQDERPELREFESPLTASVLSGKRPEILSALWAMVRSWDEAGRPPASCHNSSFPEWGQIIGGIVENAGYNCPMEVVAVESAADSIGADMLKLARILGVNNPNIAMPFGDVIKIAIYNGLFESLLPADENDLDKAQKARFGSLLKKFDRRVYQGCFQFSVDGSGHGRKFLVKNLKEQRDPTKPM